MDNIIRVHIGTLGMQHLLKFIPCIADQVQEAAAIPEDCPHISGIHPRKSAMDTVDQRIPLLVLFSQFILRAEHIMGEFQPCPVPLPADLQILDHKCPAQSGIIELPLIKIIFVQFAVGAERAGGGTSLDHFITLTANCFRCRHAKNLAGSMIQIKKLICIHITDIGISFVCIQHRLEAMVLLLA